ncbi:MAG: sugar ABC transporter permease, partial [Acidisphaera sp.]|nr:sugar ABC transporter permease [Acidisphaera sp.]
MRLRQRQAATAWIFLALPLIFYVGIRLWPALDAFLLSLSRWNLVGPRVFVGMDNYVRIFSDP